MSIRYYGVKGDVNGESPIIKIPANAAGTFDAGKLYQVNSSGKLIAYAASGTAVIGLCEFEQKVAADEEVELRELSTNIYLEQSDSTARVIGTVLDLTAAGAFTTDNDHDVIIVRNSSASEPTVFRLQARALAVESD